MIEYLETRESLLDFVSVPFDLRKVLLHLLCVELIIEHFSDQRSRVLRRLAKRSDLAPNLPDPLAGRFEPMGYEFARRQRQLRKRTCCIA